MTQPATHQAVCRLGAAVTRTMNLVRLLAATNSKEPFLTGRLFLLQDFIVVGVAQAIGFSFGLVHPSARVRDRGRGSPVSSRTMPSSLGDEVSLRCAH